MHHERLDGSGYHKACGGAAIGIAARVLAAADAFQAMTQHRPHRRAFDPEMAGKELRSDARLGRLDSAAVEAVLAAAGQPHQAHGRPRRPGGWSDREVEVLRLVAEGCSWR